MIDRIQNSPVVAVVVALILILTSLQVAPLAGAAGENSGFGVDELREGGEQVSDDVESLRVLDDGNALFVDTAPTNPLQPDASGSLKAGDVVEPGDRVEVRDLRFKSLSTESFSDTLHIVYWQVGDRQVERNGTVVSEQVATNVTHDKAKLDLNGSFATDTVQLRRFSEPTRVTMWLDSAPDTARWSFTYRTSPTAQQVTTDTAGERLWWLAESFLFWMLAFGFTGFAVVRWMRKRAGAGPQMGIGTWVLLLGISSFIAVAAAFQGIASLFVRAPLLLSGFAATIMLIPYLEDDSGIRRHMLIQPVVTDAVSAAGESAKDVLYLRLKSIRVVENSDETLSVVKPGPIKFLARVLGGSAPLTNAADMEQTKVKAKGSKFDRVTWIAPGADEILDYQPEHFQFKRPTDRALLVSGVGLSLIVANSVLVGSSLLGWLGAAISVLSLLTGITVKSGHAKVEPASAHVRSAHVTAMLLSKDMDEAETLDEYRESTYRERAKSSKDVEKVVALRDQTVVSEMLGVDVGATADDDGPLDVDEPDDEQRRRNGSEVTPGDD